MLSRKAIMAASAPSQRGTRWHAIHLIVTPIYSPFISGGERNNAKARVPSRANGAESRRPRSYGAAIPRRASGLRG
jgi:hypothetical protein